MVLFRPPDRHHFDNPVYSTAFTGSPMASIATASHPMRARIAASNGGTSDSLNNSRVVNRFAKKNVNSERERLGALVAPAASATASAYLENDEEEQDSLSDRGSQESAGSDPYIRRQTYHFSIVEAHAVEQQVSVRAGRVRIPGRQRLFFGRLSHLLLGIRLFLLMRVTIK